MNPGQLREHSIVAVECACKIAKECPDRSILIGKVNIIFDCHIMVYMIDCKKK